jgi:hypothetical protein
MTHEDSYNIIHPLQHMFHRSRSCEPQFLEFINVFNNIKDGSLLLHKLKNYCIGVKLIPGLKAFVRQAVIIEGEISAYVPDEYGVSQGSVLSLVYLCII